MPQRFLDATRSEWHLERDGDALVLHLARPVTTPLTVRAGGETVAVVREGRHALLGPFDARFRHVLALEAEDGDRVEIRAGVEAGERVVLEPAGLVDGARVIEQQAASEAGPAGGPAQHAVEERK